MNEHPPGMRAIGVSMSGTHLGQPGTPEALLENLGALRATDIAQSAAKILIWMEDPGRDPFGAGQRELVQALFPEEVAKLLMAALEAGSDGGGFDVVFHPGQLLALQKLAARVSQPGPPTSFDDGSLVGRFVLAAAQVIEIRDALVGGDSVFVDNLSGAMYGVLAAEQNHIAHAPTSAGRAFRLWLDSRIPWPEGLEQPDAYCERRFGVALRQFVAVASAAALSRIDIDVSDPGSVPFNPNTYFEDTRIEPGTAIRILNELRYESPAQDPSAAVHDPANFWSFFDLADRPLVPCGTNIVAPCSIRYSLERGSTGVFWMLHASHRGDVRAFTTHFGHLFEDYCLRVAEGLHSVTTVVSGEIEYGPPSSRQRSADILISTLGTHGQPARVFIECRAGRPPSAVFTHSSRDAFANYVEDLVGKLLQLDRVVGDHQAGAFAIPGDLAGADDAYLPMLVVDVPFHWTFSLRTLLDDAIRSLGIFRRPHVAQPIVCSIEELESLVHACETGADLAELLRSHLFNDRMDPLQLLILEKTGPLQPPSFTEGGWSEWRELVNHELFG